MMCMIPSGILFSPLSICSCPSGKCARVIRAFSQEAQRTSFPQYRAVLVLIVVICRYRYGKTLAVNRVSRARSNSARRNSQPIHSVWFEKIIDHLLYYQIHDNPPFSLLDYRLKLECEKLTNEKTEMQRHYVMVSKH